MLQHVFLGGGGFYVPKPLSLGYEPSTLSVAGTSLTLVRDAAVPNADKVTLVPCHTLS